MTEPQTAEASPSSNATAEAKSAFIIYILYLAAFVSGITPVIGVVMAYIYKGPGSSWIDSHYQLQIRTFWIGLLYLAISFLATMILIGWPLLAVVAVWYIVRCVKGIKHLQSGTAYPNPTSWLW
jgi:uncharacterized membrane protein